METNIENNLIMLCVLCYAEWNRSITDTNSEQSIHEVVCPCEPSAAELHPGIFFIIMTWQIPHSTITIKPDELH